MEQYKADFLEVLKECFKFDGTLNRTKFWTYSLVLFLASFLFNGCIQVVGKVINNNIIMLVIGLISFIVSVAIWAITLGPAIRRLRDGGFSPLLYLVALVPCIGQVALIVLLCLPSKDGAAVATAPAQPAAEQPQDQPPAGN